jgi:hypothetical protein
LAFNTWSIDYRVMGSDWAGNGVPCEVHLLNILFARLNVKKGGNVNKL